VRFERFHEVEPKGGATAVTWDMQGPTPFFAKIIHVFLDMDKMVGNDFETGLANLKAAQREVAERGTEQTRDRQTSFEERHMPYVDGFVVPVPKKNLAAYRSMARKAGKVWREHGAIEFRECVADDVKVGKWTSFPRSVKLKRGETVMFSYIVYKSRADRDRVLAKVMKDKRLAKMMDGKAMPFDAKRMIYGGFKSIVDL